MWRGKELGELMELRELGGMQDGVVESLTALWIESRIDSSYPDAHHGE